MRLGKVTFPRRQPLIEEFAAHLTADAKVLHEDEETGMKQYRYVKTGVNHYDFAFSYALMATKGCPGGHGWLRFMSKEIRKLKAEGRIPS